MNKKNNSAITIMRRELAAYFTNPAAYIVTGLFLIFAGILFFSTFFLNGRADLRNFFSLLPLLMSLFVPALTMRLFSEEMKSGSFETLMTLPVTECQIVLGKFLASFLTSAAMLVPTLFYVITANIFGKPDAGPIIGGYIGALFLCAAYSAIGIFSSSITKNQIIAFFTALAISFALTLVGNLLVFMPAPIVRLFSWISVSTHFQSISRGIVDSRDIIYFITLSAVFILITIRKFIINWTKENSLDFILALVIFLLANLVSGRAFFRSDLTANKIYSISGASKELVKNLQEPLSVNVFFTSDLPAPYNSVDQYLRDLLVEYKSAGNSNFSYKFFDMSKPASEDTARSYGLNQTQVQKVETTEVSAKTVWMSVALVYGDNIKTFDSLNSTAGLEYKLTTAISKMISTSDAIASLHDGLTLTLYPASEIKEYGIAGLDKLETAVNSAVSKLNKKFGGQISFRLKNAGENEAEFLGTKYGIQAVSYQDPNTQTEKTTALGLVLELGDQFRTIPIKLQNFFGWRLMGMENLQDNIDSSIESLLSKTVEIGYITGHGETSLYSNPYSNGQTPSSENFRNILNDIYTLKEINLSKDNIPLNIKCIVINGAKNQFGDSELRKIDQFVMTGGNLLICQEPLAESMDNGPNAPPSYKKPETGLDKLLNAYGIKADANYIMDENCYESRQGMTSIKLNWAPLLMHDQINRKNPITKFIPGMIFLQDGSINIDDADKNKDLKVTVLAKSSDKSWTVSDNIILYPGYIFPPTDKAEIHENNLAVLVEGKFKSAFAGIPLTQPEEDSSKNDSIGTDAPLKASENLETGIQNAKIIFINSSQVTTDQLIANSNEPMAYFLRNSVDYLNGAEDFCEMRTKGISQNLLEVKKPGLATTLKLFNQFGLAVLVALAGLLVWRLRVIRRNEIRIKYDPEDSRHIESTKEKEVKNEE